MRKIVFTLSVLLVLVLAFAVTSCGSHTETTTQAVSTTEPIVTTQPPITSTAPETTKSDISEDYVVYDNGSISFVYPKNYVKWAGETVLIKDVESGNNITIVSEKATNKYANLDKDDYVTMFKPAFEAMGMKIFKYNVEKVKNENNVVMTKITHTASLQGQTMRQTLLIVTSGKTYTITITEMVNDDELVNNLQNSLIRPK